MAFLEYRFELHHKNAIGEQLAKVIGKEVSVIRSYRSGLRFPPDPALRAIADYLRPRKAAEYDGGKGLFDRVFVALLDTAGIRHGPHDDKHLGRTRQVFPQRRFRDRSGIFS